MQITRSFLRDAGLGGLPHDAIPGYLANLEERLWGSIAARVAPSLTAAERAALASLLADGEAERLARWLGSRVPGARVVVRAERETLKAKVRTDAEAILAIEALASSSNSAGHEYSAAANRRRFSI